MGRQPGGEETVFSSENTVTGCGVPGYKGRAQSPRSCSRRSAGPRWAWG